MNKGSNKVRIGLVSTLTEDGVRLDGALYEPEDASPIASLITHGAWGNFYTGLGRFLPGALAAYGIACLSLNNRGHDYGTVADGEPCIGLLREQFEDSPKDIAAGLQLLKQSGYRRLVVIAHSYGTSKVVYSHFLEPDPDVVSLILCTPPVLMRDAWKYYLDVQYEKAVRDATHLVNTGQGEQFVIFRHHGPAPIICTARTFLSVWGPSTSMDMCRYIGELDIPILITICERDSIFMDYSRLVYEHAVRADPREFIIIPGGDHYYRDAERPLEKIIFDWLNRVGLK